MTLISHVGTAELKSFYSKQLLDRLVGAIQLQSLKFPFILRHVKPVRLKDKMPRLPQSIQYPPGMEPKKTIERRRFESYTGFPAAIKLAPSKPMSPAPGTRLPMDKLIPTTFIQATEPKNAKGGDVWYRS